MLAARRFAQENPQAGQANLAAEGPPPAKPSTAARTSFAADAAEWEHEEKNAHHADNHPKNGVVHMPLPSLLWRDLSQERSRLNLPGLVEDAHPAWSHQESKDDEDDPGNDRASDESHDTGDHKHGCENPQDVSASPLAASIPRTPNISPPFILRERYRGRRSAADSARAAATRPGEDGYSSGSTGVTVSSDSRRSTSSRSASAVWSRSPSTSWPHVKVCT